MSDQARSALPGATAAGLVSITEAGLQGMVTLRADLADAATSAALAEATGCAMPRPRRVTQEGGVAVAWMSPDELMIFCPHAEADALAARLGAAMGDAHHLALTISDARAVFDLKGPGWRDVLGKVTPADLSTDAFGPGEIRRTRLAQVAAAFWITGEDQLRVICFRSVAKYVFDLLQTSAGQDGAVDYH